MSIDPGAARSPRRCATRTRRIHIALLLSVLWVGIVAGPQSSHAIVGGHDAPLGAYPSVAFISYVNLGVSFECTGTLIAPRWVLTAGHCGSATGLVGNSPAQWPPALINIRIGGDTRSGGERVTADQTHGHPSQSFDIRYDIALIRLAAPSTKTPTKVVASTETSSWAPGTLETIVGWGQLANGNTPNRLQEAQVPITTDAYCSGAYGSSFDVSTMVCAGYPEGGVDTCQGDSGGPMFGSAGGVRRVVGTTSWGEGCGEPGKPGVYARVGAPVLRDWIKSLAPDGVA